MKFIRFSLVLFYVFCSEAQIFDGGPLFPEPPPDTNDCSTSLCGPNQRCIGTTTSHICVCNRGFTPIPCELDLCCVNEDECSQTDLCLPLAGTCVNHSGRFICVCNDGFEPIFTPTGLGCRDMNECENDPCDENAECINQPGSHTCTCNAGYSGDGHSCVAFCLLPDAPANGRITDFNFPPRQRSEYSVGDYISYRCDLGYKLSGNQFVRRRCTSDGSWTGEAPTCVGSCLRQCAIFQPFPVELPTPFPTRPFPTLPPPPCGCDPSCKDDDSCCEDYDEICVGCPPPEVPEHGRIARQFPRGHRNLYSVGAYISYECDAGYRLSDNANRRRCIFDGTWTGEVPTCIGSCLLHCQGFRPFPGGLLTPFPTRFPTPFPPTFEPPPCGCDPSCKKRNSCCDDYEQSCESCRPPICRDAMFCGCSHDCRLSEYGCCSDYQSECAAAMFPHGPSPP